jgi:hypothetical protein
VMILQATARTAPRSDAAMEQRPEHALATVTARPSTIGTRAGAVRPRRRKGDEHPWHVVPQRTALVLFHASPAHTGHGNTARSDPATQVFAISMPWAWAAQRSVKNSDTPAGSRARLGPGPGDLPAAQPVFCVLFQGGGEIEPMNVEAAARVSAFGMARRAGVRRSRARGVLFPMLCQAIAAPARAQLAENNAVTAAEDAFGSSVGGPCVGLAAQADSLPSPAGIADLRLHVPDEATSLSTSTYGGAYGQAGVLVEGKAPVSEHVSGGLGASFYRQ